MKMPTNMLAFFIIFNNNMTELDKILYGLNSVIYPHTCVGCEQLLYAHETVCCGLCLSQLPLIDNNDGIHNEMAEKIYGRIPSTYHFSLFHFHKNHFVQEILHYIKYKNGQQIAFKLGAQLGDIIRSKDISIDHIIPLPLHPKKLLKRGYNQAQIIAEGISSNLSYAPINHSLKRIKNTDSQTQKSRLERIHNVSDAFEWKEDNIKNGQNHHYLIVDDVLTTGATLEAAAHTILKQCPEAKISLATLALANDG